jgi:radical SAM protein with 4Fe4S-binding SPASM domain
VENKGKTGGITAQGGQDVGPDLPPLPAELYVEVTNRCNSRCQTCVRTFDTLEPARDMTLAELAALTDQVPDLCRAVLHGVGEPLLNPELPAMVAHLKGRARPPQVLFNSNAILLAADLQEALLTAGLDELRVSTDAAHRELYRQIRGVDAFERVTKNVKTLVRRIAASGSATRVSLWFTALRENLDDLSSLVRLAHDLGVGEVYVQRLVYFGQGLARQEQSLFRSMQEREDALLAEATALARTLGIHFRASGATSPHESLSSRPGKAQPWAACRRPWSLAYVTANGNVLPCCFSPFTTRDYAGLILGNVYTTPLAEIWQGAAYSRFRQAQRSPVPPEACDRCGMDWSL